MLELLHFAITCALIGLIWTIQLVKYPGFRLVPDAAFVAYHEHHTQSIPYIVLPLMGVELGLVAWLAWENGWAWPQFMPMLMVVGIWLSTVGLQIPAHKILAEGKNGKVIERLILTNWIRTVLWTVKGLWLGWLLA